VPRREGAHDSGSVSPGIAVLRRFAECRQLRSASLLIVEALTRHMESRPESNDPALELCMRAVYVAACVVAKPGEPNQGVSPLAHAEIRALLKRIEEFETRLGPALAEFLSGHLCLSLCRETLPVRQPLGSQSPGRGA